MKNLVMSPAVGLEEQPLNIFLKTLRRYYDDEILLLIGREDFKLKELAFNYKCLIEEVSTHKHSIQMMRYKFFSDFLKKEKYNKIFFCDSRDIYFQSDPFKYEYNPAINFFSEGRLIKDCKINSNWINKTYGEQILNEFKKKEIICFGTVLANQENMIKYLDEMSFMVKKYPYKKRLKYLLTFRRDKTGRGCDQAYGTYLVYKNYFKSFKIHSNSFGPIATVYYLKNLNFNVDSNLVNEKNQPYNVVHQYDKRWFEFEKDFKIFTKI